MSYDKPKTSAAVFALGLLNKDIIPAFPRWWAVWITLLIGNITLFVMFACGVWDVHADVAEHNLRAGLSAHERAVWESSVLHCFNQGGSTYYCAPNADREVGRLRRAQDLLSQY